MSVWAPEKIELPSLPGEKKKFDVRKAAKEAFIDRKKKIEKPPFCVSFLQGSEETGVLTLGDFSLITGPAKSRKTFLTSMITAAALNNETDICGMIRGNLPEGKKNLLYLDTEQSDWHAQTAVRRAERMAGPDESPYFYPYMLRDYSTEERKELLEFLIEDTPEVGFVVIDGIRDLVISINDEAESKSMVDWLMKLSKKYRCHIMVVIHENKVGGQIRGHLGTELQNKAQAVLSVKKDENDENVSIVSSREARDKYFKPFAIYFNETTKSPDIDQEYEIQGVKKKKGFEQQPPKKRLESYTPSEHIDMLKKVFFIPKLRGSQLRESTKSVYSTYSDFYSKDAERCANFFLEAGYVETNREEEPNKSKQVFWLSEKTKDGIAPF